MLILVACTLIETLSVCMSGLIRHHDDAAFEKFNSYETLCSRKFRVYEASCDAASAAGAAAFPELLKSLQALEGPDGEELYARAAAQQHQQQQRQQQHNKQNRGNQHSEEKGNQLQHSGQRGNQKQHSDQRGNHSPPCKPQQQQKQQKQQRSESTGCPDQYPPLLSDRPLSDSAGIPSPASVPGSNEQAEIAATVAQSESATVAAAPVQTTAAHLHLPPPLTSRAAEMAAAHVLFFACVPHNVRKMEVVSTLAAAAAGPHWNTPCMQYAVQVCCSLAKADVHGLLRLRTLAPPPIPRISSSVLACA
eukprot:1149846-Pelagomonas_calceolata.AAC.3